MYFLLFTCSCIHQGVFLKCQMGKLKCFTYAKRTALLVVIIYEDPHFSENMSIQGLVLTLKQIYCPCQMTMRWTKSSKVHVAVRYSKIFWLETMIHRSMQFFSNTVLHQDNAYVWFRVLWAGYANFSVCKGEKKLTAFWPCQHCGKETHPWSTVRMKRNIWKDTQNLSCVLASLFGKKHVGN